MKSLTTAGHKRPRAPAAEPQQEPPQPLIAALDAIVNPLECMVEYTPTIVADMRAVKDRAMEADEDLYNLYLLLDDSDDVTAARPSFVRRSSADKLYLMSQICVNIGRLEEIKPRGMADAIKLYNEALFWHPDSLEGALCLGLALRHECAAQVQLDRVEDMWQKAYDSARSYSFLSSSSVRSIKSDVPYSSFNRMIQSREKKMLKELADKLILHYCQEDKLSLAVPIMNAYHYRYKLSQTILCYPRAGSSSSSQMEGEGCSFAGGIDSAVPPVVLEKLQHVFRPDAPFWAEHSYDFYSNASRGVGYFSYLYPFRELAPGNVVEQAIQAIYSIISTKFPNVAQKSTIAEWWVHSRPHSSGHQFHFDSDETLIYAGKNAQHPIMSCVLYLTPDCGRDESVGGPTVITNQTLQSQGLATEGFMFLPKENRMVTFDSKYLHGVVPGRGICPGPENSRRVTFMVGFWEKIESKTRGVDCPGPGQPFPGRHLPSEEVPVVAETMYTWPAEMGLLALSPEEEGHSKSLAAVDAWLEPIILPEVWDPVNSEEGVVMERAAATGLINNYVPINAHYDQCFQGF